MASTKVKGPARRYAAFLRGVMPTNAKMPQLKKCFEAAGFTEVRTLLASGNVVFSAGAASEASLERRAEAAMSEQLGRVFLTIVRSMDRLQAMVDSDPFAAFRLPPGSKQMVTFLRKVPTSKLAFPVEADSARILCVKDTEIFTSYVPSARGAVFMKLIEQTFGLELTTRTWDTVKRVAAQ